MLDEASARFTLAVLVLLVGVLLSLGLYRFGMALFRFETSGFIQSLWAELQVLAQRSGQSPRFADRASTWYEDYLEKRNAFWAQFGEVALAVLIVVVLTVLLLSKAISPEAGLPILSGVAGFAIAKTGRSPDRARRTEQSPPPG